MPRHVLLHARGIFFWMDATAETQKPCASGDKGNGLKGTFGRRGGDRNYEGTAFPRRCKEHPRIQRYE